MNTVEVTPIDTFTWVAHLDDGSTIPELNEDGLERGWADVPAERVVTIELKLRDESRHLVMLEVPPGAVAGFGRRRQLRANPETGETAFLPSITVLSWARDGVGVWVYVLDDGMVAVSDRLQ